MSSRRDLIHNLLHQSSENLHPKPKSSNGVNYLVMTISLPSHPHHHLPASSLTVSGSQSLQVATKSGPNKFHSIFPGSHFIVVSFFPPFVSFLSPPLSETALSIKFLSNIISDSIQTCSSTPFDLIWKFLAPLVT